MKRTAQQGGGYLLVVAKTGIMTQRGGGYLLAVLKMGRMRPRHVENDTRSLEVDTPVRRKWEERGLVTSKMTRGAWRWVPVVVVKTGITTQRGGGYLLAVSKMGGGGYLLAASLCCFGVVSK